MMAAILLSGCAVMPVLQSKYTMQLENAIQIGANEDRNPIKVMTATYLGVDQYGEEETNSHNIESFRYRFETEGEETLYAIKTNQNQENAYPLQNLLKEGYTYHIFLQDEVVLAVKELQSEDEVYQPIVAGTPGIQTIGNFLKTAMEPVGTTLYIYGGGWGWQDEGSAIQARSIGVSSDWVKFFKEQDENYTYRDKDGDTKNKDPKNSYYPYGNFNQYYYAGLDCSAYISWALYNCLNTGNDGEGMVSFSTGFAKKLADSGYGSWTKNVKLSGKKNAYNVKPGDIISVNGHVWISLGTCSDNSIVIAHSTPNPSRTGQPGGGVQIGAVGFNEACEAYQLADHYMSTYFPEWYERYPVCLKEPQKYFNFKKKETGRFRWDTKLENGFSDPDGCQNMTAKEVLQFLFGE